MYTKYNYIYKSTIKKYHTHIQVCILNIISYSYTSMYTKYNYINKSTIKTQYHTHIRVCILNIITYI